MKKMSFLLSLICGVMLALGLFFWFEPSEKELVDAMKKDGCETYNDYAMNNYLVLNGYGGVFAFGEEIFLKGTLHGEQRISNIQTSGEGFGVLGLWQKDDGFELSVVLVSTENPPMIEILCRLDDGGTLSTAVYSYVAEDKVFLGEGNLDAAFESYCGYARENHTIPDPDLEQLRSEFYNACVTTTVTTSPSKMRSGNATIDGHIYWIDDQKVIEGSGRNNQHICTQVKVELCFLENGKEVKSKNLNTTTSDRGYYSFTFSAPDNTDGIKHEFFIRTYCENAKSSIKVVSEEGAEYPIESDKVGSVYANTVTHIQLDINMSTTSGQAMQITQAIIYAEKYMMVMSGINAQTVLARYPVYSISDSKYNVFFGRTNEIWIRKPFSLSESNGSLQPYANWDKVMHEYGHHVQTHFDISDNPGGEHDGINNIKLLLSQKESYKTVKNKALRLTWAESWATFFGMMAQIYFGNELTDIPSVGDFVYNGYKDSFYNYKLHESLIYRTGEACEASILDVLFDIFDDETDGDNRDEISLGHQGVWDMVIESKAKTFNDFVQYMYKCSETYKRSLDPLLKRAHFTSNYVTCYVDDFTKTSPTSNFDIFTKGGYYEGNIDYSNNKIIANVYDGNGKFLFTINENGALQLSVANLRTVLQAEGYNIEVYLIEYQDDGFMKTGPYYSYHTVSKPEPPELRTWEPQTVTLSSTHVFEIFTFVAPSSGTYSFYTEHDQTVYMAFWGQLYSRPVIDTDNPSAYRLADHWPGSGDFKINYALTAGQRVYLRANSRNSSGTFTVNVKKI